MATRKNTGKAASVKKTVKAHESNDFRMEIMERAFNLYLQRIKNGNVGDEINDWLVAENEIRKSHGL